MPNGYTKNSIHNRATITSLLATSQTITRQNKARNSHYKQSTELYSLGHMFQHQAWQIANKEFKRKSFITYTYPAWDIYVKKLVHRLREISSLVLLALNISSLVYHESRQATVTKPSQQRILLSPDPITKASKRYYCRRTLLQRLLRDIIVAGPYYKLLCRRMWGHHVWLQVLQEWLGERALWGESMFVTDQLQKGKVLGRKIKLFNMKFLCFQSYDFTKSFVRAA